MLGGCGGLYWILGCQVRHDTSLIGTVMYFSVLMSSQFTLMREMGMLTHIDRLGVGILYSGLDWDDNWVL